MNKLIMTSCFGERYRGIEVNESEFFSEYFLIDNSFILTFYNVSEKGIPIAELQGDIIESIQANLNEDRFQKYEIYIIFVLDNDCLISIREKNEIEKDKFCCRKIFFTGEESELEQFLNERFNLGNDISKFKTNLGGKETEFVNLINNDILPGIIDDDKDIVDIDSLCSFIEKLKSSIKDKCDNVKFGIEQLRSLEDEN